MASYIKWIRSKVGHQKIILNFSAGILSDNANAILLQKRSDENKWGLPGGALEVGESAYGALKREFKEETGLNIQPSKLLGMYSKYFDSYPNGDTAQTVTSLFEVGLKSGKQEYSIDSSETLDLRFFSRDKILQIKIVNQQHKDMINDFFEQYYPIDR
ncbi:mutT/nudix family protein [Pediococcus damnosus]|uniref:MutT/nudix family protein n=1 Tax=Pediococcus damnosus TaxID=51663 RepID=A0A0R2HH70_9LACO|nr:NUDIX domain-containing protein [Pediococcus damnosus]AMV63474.1 mutT/nudix family protein [Pediococcus damnosus]AMV66591.1 mutT/nudix family protein [Pediococcus damnosus]AMV68880.1 mutT/nudix family protein [Pediococcus damnosus]KJU75061.1 DNA mismatch repair protein MutT [Pediococcus damnosus LMG 28219]KRN52384.1 hypothetical protein IV84_GL000717 [Pediococcus damnosus]